MNVVTFAPGKAGSLTSYLGYLFLRFPGALGAEETLDLELADTYDRRWLRQGWVWVRRDGTLTLVSPPSLFPLAADPREFGLQTPVSLGTLKVTVRPVSFASPDSPPVTGAVVKAKGRTFLVLEVQDTDRFAALFGALTAEGLEPVAPGSVRWTGEKEPWFAGPSVPELPLTGEPATGFLVDRMADALRVARQYEPGIRDDVDTECLHQYRVFLRRARSLTSLGRQWLVVPEARRLKDVLRTLQQHTNELRDLDVLLLGFAELQAQLPWDEGTRLEDWRTSLVRRRQAELKLVSAWLGSTEYRALADEAGRLFTDLRTLGEPWTVAELASQAFARAAKGLRQCLKGLGPDSPDEALHEVRIEAKRLRYVLDSLGFVGPPAAVRSLVSQLKGAQDGLGAFQDRSVLLSRLDTERAAFRTARAPGDPLSFGVLVGVLTAGHQAERVRALRDCKTLRSRDFQKTLDRLAGTHPEAPHAP